MPLRLMCLTAHPDDEAGAFAAALLDAADLGAQTAVLCLTEGAAGSYREPGQTDEELAARRRQEFAEACAILHVSHTELLRYPDGGLWQEPFLSLTGVLVGALRRFRPHVVLTFGGEGGVNLHRDHTAVSLAGTAAFHWAARTGMFEEQGSPWAAQKLYYAATPFLSTKDEEAQRLGTRTPVSLRMPMDERLRGAKLAAFEKHTSQRGLLERVQSEFAQALHEEDFLLAAARVPVERETSLWDGVVDE